MRTKVPSFFKSGLLKKLLVVNLLGLILFFTGAFYISSHKLSLINIQVKSLVSQGEIIAASLVHEAVNANIQLNENKARNILRRLVVPTATRARLYDLDGFLVEDTDNFAIHPVISFIPEEDINIGFWKKLNNCIDTVFDKLTGTHFPPLIDTTTLDLKDIEEGKKALDGKIASTVQRSTVGDIIVNVAIPVKRYGKNLGVLILSTEANVIQKSVTRERIAMIELFIFTLIITFILSLILALTIVRPLQILSRSAQIICNLNIKASVLKKLTVPDFSGRKDEISDLATSFKSMIIALEARLSEVENFASDVSHEIKNPLTSLKSAFETLKLVEDKDKKEKLRKIISHDIYRIDRLISDITNSSRLDGKMLREKRQVFNLLKILETLQEVYVSSILQNGPNLKIINNTKNLPLIEGLEERISQVFCNIIDNAITFTPKNKYITIEITEDDENIITQIKDDGIGIPFDALDKIFTRFYSHRPIDADYGHHSGLGLAIVKQILDAHEGTIVASNILDEHSTVIGACFTVTIPKYTSD